MATVSGPSLIPEITVLDIPLSLFLLQIAIILTTCRFLAIIGQYFHQPSVVFEIVGGILLGPSALGKYTPYSVAILPLESLSYLKMIANFGLQIYLFLVGMELDLRMLKSHSRTTASIAITGMIVPFVLGMAVGIPIYNSYDKAETHPSFITFSVFIGTAMAITALPVLSRILKENSLMKTKAGSIALGAAVITDAFAWVLLVVAISLATASSSAIAGWIFFAILGYAAIMFTAIRWVFHAIVRSIELWSQSEMVMINMLSITAVLLFLSSSLVAQFGIDPIVGSFIFGVIIPRHSRLYRMCIATLENFVVILLLPLYFAVSGLRTDLTTLRAYPDVLFLLLVCTAATVGKLLGAGLPAFFSGVGLRDSAIIAALMNTRGLVELIVLNIGKEFGVLNNRTFAILVIMCLFTTFLTCPLLYLIGGVLPTTTASATPSRAVTGSGGGGGGGGSGASFERNDSSVSGGDSGDVERGIELSSSGLESQTSAKVIKQELNGRERTDTAPSAASSSNIHLVPALDLNEDYLDAILDEVAAEIVVGVQEEKDEKEDDEAECKDGANLKMSV